MLPGGKAKGAITIHNHGTDSIRVARFETSCPCVRVPPSSMDLNADETREVTVEFDAAEEPEFRGSLGVTLESLASSNEEENGSRNRYCQAVRPSKPPLWYPS